VYSICPYMYSVLETAAIYIMSLNFLNSPCFVKEYYL